ncbi:MAG: PadR family transcriptional regulator [Bacillota bacterium]
MNINPGFVRNHAKVVILNLLTQEDSYGYRIIEELETSCEGQYAIKRATAYNILNRLAKEGLISSYYIDDEETGGGRRKYFKIEQSGKDFLEENKRSYELSSTLMGQILSEERIDFSASNLTFDPARLNALSQIAKQQSEAPIINEQYIQEDCSDEFVAGNTPDKHLLFNPSAIASANCEKNTEKSDNIEQITATDSSETDNTQSATQEEIDVPYTTEERAEVRPIPPSATVHTMSEEEIAEEEIRNREAYNFALEALGGNGNWVLDEERGVFVLKQREEKEDAPQIDAAEDVAEPQEECEIFEELATENLQTADSKPLPTSTTTQETQSGFQQATVAANAFKGRPNVQSMEQLRNSNMRDGFRIKEYNQRKSLDYYRANHYYCNKIFRDTSALTFLFLIIEALVVFIFRDTFAYKASTLASIVFGALVVPVVFSIIWMLNPTKRVKAKINFGSIIAYGMLVFLVSIALCTILNVANTDVGINFTSATFYVPYIFALNIPVAIALFIILYKSQLYHTK